jgi:hypothetical protein
MKIEEIFITYYMRQKLHSFTFYLASLPEKGAKKWFGNQRVTT